MREKVRTGRDHKDLQALHRGVATSENVGRLSVVRVAISKIAISSEKTATACKVQIMIPPKCWPIASVVVN